MKVTAVAYRVDTLSLRDVPGLEIVAESADPASLRLAASSLCDVVLCDLDQVSPPNLAEVAELFPGTPVVGFISQDTDAFRVVDAQECGCRQFIRKPFRSEDVTQALDRLAGEDNHRGKVICAIGANGGAGATTIACNLAVQLALTGKVGLIDADLSFGNVAQYFDVSPRHTISDACACDHIDQVSLAAAMEETGYGVSLLARPKDISDRSQVTPGKAAALMHTASDAYSFVVVDLFRQLNELVGSFMLQADLVLVIAETNVTSASNARRIRRALLDEKLAKDQVAIVLNRTSKRTVHSLTKADLESTLGPIFASVPNDFPAALQASDQGKPIDASSPISKAIREMARKIVGLEQQRPQTTGRLMRFLKGAVS